MMEAVSSVGQYLLRLHGETLSRSSSFIIVSDYGRPVFDTRRRQRIFPVASVSIPTPGPTQRFIQWVPGVLSPGAKHGRGVMRTSHPRLRKTTTYTTFPPKRTVACSGAALTLYGKTSQKTAIFSYSPH
jgi:hypothetical protein